MDVDVWYRRYGESVYRRCLRMTRNETQARDLVQEVFLKAFRHRTSFRGDSSPLSWLFTIATRCFFDSVRGQKIAEMDGADILEFVRDEEESQTDCFVKHDLVVKLLSRAPKDVQQIVMARYFDELDYAQIAARHSINEKTVRRKLEKFLGDARKTARRLDAQ